MYQVEECVSSDFHTLISMKIFLVKLIVMCVY